MVVGGPLGSGKTRLAAEPAAIATRDGAAVTYATAIGPGSGVGPAIARALDTDAPTLLVLDDLESASAADLTALGEAVKTIAGRPILLVGLVNGEPSSDVGRVLKRLSGTDGSLRLGPLDEVAVAEIVATYAADPADPPPVWAIAQASGGLPAQIHALASDWARGEVARRLGSAVSRAAEGRRDLRRLEAEVASNVVDLQLARERLRLVEQSATPDTEACPFKGLVAFDVADADVFFGRERLVAEMVGRLAGSPFLGVVGPSGSGKSSAVRAGLLPALSAGALPGAEAWTTVVFRPGAQPTRELDRVLFSALPEAARSKLSALDDPLAAAAAVLPPAARPLVVVDQFEELFTTTADEAERERFVNMLVGAARDGHATIIVAVRADFYGRCATYPGLAELLGASHVLVGPMTAEEYRRAIEGPARRAGLHMDPALVDALVIEVVDEPGGLPLLSTSLVELWEQREGRAIRLAAYAATGGVRGAVGRLAEAAFARLDEEGQQIARGLFLRLSAGEGDTVVRRRVPLSELDATANERVGQVVRILTEARLLTVGEGTVEVAHEALLREWPRLQDWLEEDRAGRRLREHLIEAAREWESRGRDTAELYRGTRLATAMDWTTDHTLELNENERAFLTESRSAAAREVDRQRRNNRRLRVLLGVAGVALVVAVGAGALAFLGRNDAQHAAVAADAQRLGAQALTEKDLDRSLLLARQGIALDDNPATRANLLSALVRSPAAIGSWRPVSGRPQFVQVSPDGRHLLIANNQGENDLIVAATGKVLRDVGPGYVTFADDGSVVHLLRPPRRLEVTSVDSATVTRQIAFPFPADMVGVFWAPDLSAISSVDPDHRAVSILDSTSGALLRHLVTPTGSTTLDVVWQDDGGNVLTVDHEGLLTDPDDINAAYEQPILLRWWPAGAEAPTAAIPALREDGVWTIDVASATIAVAEDSGNVGIYDLLTGQRREMRLRHNGLAGLTFSPDGRTLVTAGDDHLLQVWDMETGQLRETLAGHNGRIHAPALSDAGGHLTAWSVGLDGQLIEWDLSGDRRLDRPLSAGRAADFEGGSAAGAAVSPDGRLLATTDLEGRVLVIDTATLSEVRRFVAVPDGQALAIAFSPDGRTLAVAGQGGAIASRWDVASGAAIGGPLPGPPAMLSRDPEAPPDVPDAPFEDASRSIAFSPDGRWIAAGVEDGRIYLWDAATGAAAGDPIPVGGPVFSVAFTPDSASIAGSYIVGDPPGSAARVWAIADKTLRYQISLGDDNPLPYATVFSPDGSLLATGGGAGIVHFWDAATGAVNGRSILASAGWVESLAFDPSGTLLVSAGTDGTIRLLDTVGRQQLGSALPGEDSDARAALSPDGKRLYAVYGGGHAFAWDISPEALEAHACLVAGRTLTTDEWERYLPGRPYEPACSGGG